MNDIPQVLSEYGDYTVLNHYTKKGYYWYVLCRCKCGIEKDVSVENLIRGLSTG
jgi:hypothetical protein